MHPLHQLRSQAESKLLLLAYLNAVPMIRTLCPVAPGSLKALMTDDVLNRDCLAIVLVADLLEFSWKFFNSALQFVRRKFQTSSLTFELLPCHHVSLFFMQSLAFVALKCAQGIALFF